MYIRSRREHDFAGKRARPSLRDQLSLARYQRREESWVFARDRLPAAYRTLFRSAVRFGNSIVDRQLRIPGPLVSFHDLPLALERNARALGI